MVGHSHLPKVGLTKKMRQMQAMARVWEEEVDEEGEAPVRV